MNTPRLLVYIGVQTFLVMTIIPGAHAETNAVMTVDHSIGKEPVYQSTPKYCLMTLGTGDTRVWMVEDGKRLYVDKNADGDLTDDGPPLELSDFRQLDANRWDAHYELDAIIPASGSRATHFKLSRWNYADKEDEYGLSLSVNDQMPMYAGWFGTFWSTNRETAPVVHFGGPFRPQLIRRKAFPIGESGQRLSLRFENPGSGPGAESMLSIDALPKALIPTLTIDWPVAPGHSPLRTTHDLLNRCCYWEFYTEAFAVPKDIVPGTAKVTVSFPESLMPVDLTTNAISEKVVAQ